MATKLLLLGLLIIAIGAVSLSLFAFPVSHVVTAVVGILGMLIATLALSLRLYLDGRPSRESRRVEAVGIALAVVVAVVFLLIVPHSKQSGRTNPEKPPQPRPTRPTKPR